MAVRQEPPTRESVIEGRISSLKAQMRKELNKEYGRKTKVWHTLNTKLTKYEKLLGKPTKAPVSPGKKEPKGDKYEKRRKPFEKLTGTSRIKEALVGVAKRAQRANEGG